MTIWVPIYKTKQTKTANCHGELPIARKNQGLTEKTIIWSTDGQRGGDIDKYEVMTI